MPSVGTDVVEQLAFSSLLVGMQNKAATWEHKSAVLYQVKYSHSIWSSNSTSKCFSKGNENMLSIQRSVLKFRAALFILIIVQTLERRQMLITYPRHKLTVVYSYNEISLSNKQEGIWIHQQQRRSREAYVKYKKPDANGCMIPFIYETLEKPD